MYCYKLLITYDGTAYSGWQVQPNADTIQERLQNVLQVLLHREKVTVIGSGRTDAGVHALGQVAHFKHDQSLDLYRLIVSINGMLPKDIRVKTIEKVPLNFHAQYSAIGKEYHYYLYLDRVMDPFRRLYCWHMHQKLNIELMHQAACLFEGTHDFTSFANESYAGSVSRDPIRTLHYLKIREMEGGIRIEVRGDGFLYKMVRNIVGALVEVASLKLPLLNIPIIFNSKDRREAPNAAPSHGLFLVYVDYPSQIHPKENCPH